jgi:hypothetical protein
MRQKCVLVCVFSLVHIEADFITGMLKLPHKMV